MTEQKALHAGIDMQCFAFLSRKYARVAARLRIRRKIDLNPQVMVPVPV
jgi:hypothetical protein